MAKAPRVSRGGRDMLGLRGAFGRLLPLIVAAMTLLAALALGGAEGAAGLARQWRAGAAASMTVQVPRPAAVIMTPDGKTASRRDRVLAALRATDGVAEVRPLGDGEVADLLRPWLGQGAEALSIPLPGVIAVRLRPGALDLERLRAAIEAAATGSVAELHEPWVGRLSLLARSLESCALLTVLLVAGLAAAVVAIATRAGLSAREDAVAIVHGLGASDGMICGRFARRAFALALMGGMGGVVVALPVLLSLAAMTAPFSHAAGGLPRLDADPETLRAWITVLPITLWAAVAALPFAAGVIGWATARATVRAWLRRLP